MKPSRLMFCGIVLLGALSAPRFASAQQIAGRLASQVDSVFAQWNRAGSPGAALVVVKNGDIIYQKGYGFANLDYDVPITSSTLFDIASVSKHFTAFAIAMLADEGKLSIDDDVRRYVPEMPDFGHRITIRNLVNHTSGIRDWVELLSIAGFRFDDVIAPTDIMTFLQHQRGLNFTPGAEYLYSNTGYNLLAEIVARVSGLSFADFMRDRIFRPLGMNDTHILVDHQRVVKNRATSYAPNENIGELVRLHRERPRADGTFRVWVDNTSAPGSSSVVTSTADMARWLRNWETAQVGGPRVREQMVQRAVLNDGQTISYAFGLSVDDFRGLTAVSHGGGWRGFRTHFLRFPQERLGIVVLGNSTSFDAGGTAERVASVLLGSRLAAAPPSGSTSRRQSANAMETPVTAPLGEYTGVYNSVELGTSYAVIERGGRLVVQHRKMDDQVLTHVGPDRFTTPGVRGQQTFEFTRDANSKVTGYNLRGARFRGVHFQRTLAAVGNTREQRAVSVPFDSLAVQVAAALSALDARTSIYARHLPSGREIAVRADQPMNTLSVIKLPIMILAFRDADAGRLNLNERYTLTPNDLRRGSGLLQTFAVPVAITWRDLITQMIITSDNTATDILIKKLGMERVNEMMAALGYRETRLRRPVGDLFRGLWIRSDPKFTTLTDREVFERVSPSDTGAAARRFAFEGDSTEWLGRSTARETARLLEQLNNGELASPAGTAEMLSILRRQFYTSRLPQRISSRASVAHKTGDWPPFAGSDVGILFYPGGPAVVAVYTGQNRGSFVELEATIGRIAEAIVDTWK